MTRPISRAIFFCGPSAPTDAADLLINAAAVTRFLCDVSGALVETKVSSGLTEHGADGLMQILIAVENTINEALSQIQPS